MNNIQLVHTNYVTRVRSTLVSSSISFMFHPFVFYSFLHSSPPLPPIPASFMPSSALFFVFKNFSLLYLPVIPLYFLSFLPLFLPSLLSLLYIPSWASVYNCKEHEILGQLQGNATRHSVYTICSVFVHYLRSLCWHFYVGVYKWVSQVHVMFEGLFFLIIFSCIFVHNRLSNEYQGNWFSETFVPFFFYGYLNRLT